MLFPRMFEIRPTTVSQLDVPGAIQHGRPAAA
jgi:hypothetical protein